MASNGFSTFGDPYHTDVFMLDSSKLQRGTIYTTVYSSPSLPLSSCFLSKENQILKLIPREATIFSFTLANPSIS